LTDMNKHSKNKRMPALHKCNPEEHAGYTKANSLEKAGTGWFCVYFARGSCTEGSQCRYYHTIPTFTDCTRDRD
jgi:hypothetical protein